MMTGLFENGMQGSVPVPWKGPPAVENRAMTGNGAATSATAVPRRPPRATPLAEAPTDSKTGTFAEVVAADGAEEHHLKAELFQRAQTDATIARFLQLGASDGLWYWDLEHPEHMWMSPEYKALFGYRDDEIPNTSDWWRANIATEDLDLAIQSLHRHCADPAYPYDQIVRYRHKSGANVWVRCRGIALRERTGRVTRVLAAHTDMTALKRAEFALKDKKRALERLVFKRTQELEEENRSLRTLVETDALTGVMNRRGAERLLSALLASIRKESATGTAVLIDCDDFKAVNDRHGHSVGDNTLCAVARAVSEALRPTDMCARIGGDEFLVLLPDTGPSDGALVAEKIRTSVATAPLPPCLEEGHISVSCGLAELRAEMTSLAEVQSACDMALRESKRVGKNRISYEGAPAASLSVTRLLAAPGSIQAIPQPIYQLSNGRLVRFEWLARGPVGPLQSPLSLFAAATEQEALLSLDLACLRIGLSSSLAAGLGAFRHHINLLPSTLLKTPAPDLLRLVSSLAPKVDLCVELNGRHCIGDARKLVESVRTLQKAGVEIAIDNVGFGSSSLEALTVLAPDIIKIDRSYVTGIAKDSERANALQRLCSVIRSLGATTIAAGIENVHDLEQAKRCGVALGQGYHWRR